MKRIFLSVVVAFTFFTGFAQDDPHGLNVNDKAPAFSGKDQHGQTISLEQELKKGPVVLVFYRGQWCPYCNRYLKKLEDALPQIQAKGATLLAVSPEIAANIDKTIQKTKASYSILHDEGLKIMKSYDVAYALNQSLIDRYKKYGLDFAVANGAENGNHLPVPAVYVINKGGTITYKFFDPDYTKRAPIEDILAHL